MNQFDENSSAVNIQMIDRLVAGELADPERREVLLKLESDPDGWKRCALAFLEDQAWRSALAGSAFIASNQIPETVPRSSLRSAWVGRLVLAASIMGVAFSAGFAVGERRQSTPNVQVAKEVPTGSALISEAADHDEVREVGWVDLVDSSRGELPPQRVPIVSGPGLDEKWLRNQAPAVPDYVRALWERQGYHLQETRNLVSVTLQDGRQVSIPFDEVAVDYVGQQPL